MAELNSISWRDRARDSLWQKQQATTSLRTVAVTSWMLHWLLHWLQSYLNWSSGWHKRLSSTSVWVWKLSWSLFCSSDHLQFPQTSTTAAESWFIWKNANSQIQSWKPRQHKQRHGWRRWWTSAADPVTHTQHYTGQAISSIQRGDIVAVWWNLKGILKE